MMRTWTVLSFLSLGLGGCAIVSATPAENTTLAAPQSEAMESRPPASPHEDIPLLSKGDVWVPGYYEPVAGTWIWHQGQVTAQKDGYRMIPASYREEGGKVFFAPPRWRRADLVPKPSELSAKK